MKRKRHAIGGIVFFITQIVVSGFSFISIAIFSRLMGRNAYGTFNNFLAVEALLFPAITLNLRASIIKSKYEFNDRREEIFSSLISTCIIAIVLFAFIFLLTGDLFEHLFNIKAEIIPLLMIYLSFNMIFLFWQSQAQIYLDYKSFAVITIILTVSQFLASAVLVIKTRLDSFMGRLVGMLLPLVLVGLFLTVTGGVSYKKIRKTIILYSLRISLPLLPGALSTGIISSLDYVMITRYCGEEKTALYAMACSICNFVGIIWTALNQAISPWFFDKLNSNETEELRTVLKSFQVVFLLVCVIVTLFAPEMVLLIGGRDYTESLVVVPAIIMSVVFQFYYSFYYNLEYYYIKQYFIMGGGILVAAVVNLILNTVFIPLYGFVAAANTTMISYLVLLVYHYLVCRLVIKKSDVYDNWFTFLLILVSAGSLCVSYNMYTYQSVRWTAMGASIVIMILFLWKYERKLKQLIR